MPFYSIFFEADDRLLRVNQPISPLLMKTFTRRLKGRFGHDASHQAKEISTHLTHWPAADRRDFLSVRSECAYVRPPVFRDIPTLIADAPRMLTEDEL